MKAVTLLAVISLALSVSAAGQGQQNNRNTNIFGGNRGRFGNNNGFGGNNGQNGQNNKNLSSNNGKNSASAAASSVKGATATAAASVKGATAIAAASSVKGATATAAAVNTAAAANTVAAAAAASTAAAAAAANNGDPQKSLTLDPKVIASGFANNGQDVPTAGQVASLTSTNNFINFCLTVPNLPITNGKQITTGSCNPAPMGVIPSSDNMPSAKFTFPKNGDTSLTENTPFTISMAVSNFQTGAFVNAQENYFAAPQQTNGQGQIIGHSHVTVEQLSALDQTTTTDPRKFVFFKGLNAAAVGGVLTADVTAGLPAGFYRLASINTAANHQPVLVPIAQHGSLDDMVYFTVTAGAASAAQASAAAAGVAAPAASAAAGSKLSAVAAPGAKVVPPAKVANPKAQQKKARRSFAREY